MWYTSLPVFIRATLSRRPPPVGDTRQVPSRSSHVRRKGTAWSGARISPRERENHLASRRWTGSSSARCVSFCFAVVVATLAGAVVEVVLEYLSEVCWNSVAN